MSLTRNAFVGGGSCFRHFVIISLLGLSVFVASGCKKALLRNQLKGLMSSTIVLPERITCVNNGEEYPMPDSVRSKAKLIIYLDSTECASCRISRLGMYHHLFQLSEETGLYEVVVLLSNIKFHGIPVLRYVSDQELEHPVYFDVENKFLELNKSIPQDEKLLHVFLVDDAGTLRCVGDPSISEKMLQVFIGAVYKLTN